MAVKKLRVSQLAKELGVGSKDIIDKCAAEGIPDVTTHQAAVGPGLAATIRDWFGSGSHTAIENAASVDVGEAKARAATAPKKSRKKAAASTEDSGDVAVAEEPKPPTPRILPPLPPPADRKPPEPRDEPEGEPDAEETTAPESPDAPVTVGRGPAAVMNVPTRPKEVRPVGPQLTRPDRTKLSGPQVVRIEHAEPVSRRPTGPTFGVGARAPLPDRGPPRPDQGRRGGTGISSRTGAGAGTRTPTGRTGKSGRGAGEEPEGGAEGWRARDLQERENRLTHAGGFFKQHRRDNFKRVAPAQRAAAAKPTGPVRIAAPFTVKELSEATGVKAAQILGKLLMAGVTTTINSVVDADAAAKVMEELRKPIEVVQETSAAAEVQERLKGRVRTDAKPRAPVVTILGHVDHGKTSLLDRIRNANVAAGEAGGITQATSAFSVPVRAGDRERTITFIDTPGHEAFTAMRARGAKVTDIAVLVVAADDGVMPQTEESIRHATAAGVPIVVALNKIDKPEATDANLNRIFGQLAEHGLNPVEWGGSTELVKTSATKGTGIQDLLDVLDYQAELLGLVGDVEGHAQGVVLEARMEEGRGAVANLLVQEGILRKGDAVAVGRAFGRVRDILDDRGNRVEEAGPSSPVAISGLDCLPDAGDNCVVLDDLRAAEEAAEEIRHEERRRDLAAPKITLDNILEHLGKGKAKELPVVVKADVQGSVETLKVLLPKVKDGDIAVAVKHCAVGGINESDVLLAATTGAIVIGFNVTSSAKARALAEEKGVELRLYEVIYHLTEDLQKAVAGLLEPEVKLEVLGHAEVRAVFRISKVGAIAGCYVTDGVVERNAQIRVTRDGIVIEKDRRLEQLKRFKDDAKEVRAGTECGMKIAGYDDIREGDVLECYKSVTVAPKAGNA